MSDEINKDSTPQCHAYSTVGDRCTNPAGHPGKHAMLVLWDESECWAPGREAAPNKATRTDFPDVPMFEEDELGDDGLTVPGKCFACGHRWHDTECGGTTQGMACGCSTAVA